MASMEVVGAQDVELKFVAAGEWLVSSLMNNLIWSKLEKDPRFALSGHGLPLYWLSRGQSSDWFVFWHLLWYLEKLSLKVKSFSTVLSARTPTSLPLMRPFVLTLLLLPADQNYAVPGHIYNILQFSTIFVYGFQTEREAMKLLLLFAVVNVISFSKSQYCEGQCQGIFPLVNYHVDK